jgi:hypothetical protein
MTFLTNNHYRLPRQKEGWKEKERWERKDEIR